MRLLSGLLALSLIAAAAGQAHAVGHTPGGTLQRLGWGYGAGYHAPIAHAYPPVGRAIRHAPGGHLFGSRHSGRSCPSPHGCCLPSPYNAYELPSTLDESLAPTVEPVPEAPEELYAVPDGPVPPAPDLP